MRELDASCITEILGRRIDEALRRVEPECLALLNGRLAAETVPNARWALELIVQNAALAKERNMFACQDCGQAMIFLEIGQDVHICGNLYDAVQAGVEQGYRAARKSVAHPLSRQNTGTNTPAIVYTEIIPGETVNVSYLSKGAGAENMSGVYMLTPSKGRQGIVNSVVDCVKKAGANPCPPLILGVGIGGTMDYAALLSKRALLRPAGTPHVQPDEAALEREILAAVNALHIGAQGLGGGATALAVHVETHHTHIGMLPVAVTLQCHSVRHFTMEI